MSVKRFEIILMVMMAIFVIAVISLIVLIARNVTEAALNKFVIAFVVFLVVWFFVLILVPVRCDKPGCQGQMRQNWVADGPGQSRLQFVCDRCGEVYDTRIGVGLGEPW